MTTEQTATALPREEAVAEIHNNIYAPTFFNKLAEVGVTPETPEQAHELLMMGAKLRLAHDKQAMATESPLGSLLKRASVQLDETIRGSEQPPADTDTEVVMQKAAAALSQEPQFAHAILSLQAATQQPPETQTNPTE